MWRTRYVLYVLKRWPEMACHLFLHGRIAAGFWYAINRWFGVCSVIPPSLPLSYAILVGYGSNRKRRKGLSVIWLAFVWVLWRVRNDRVFNNVGGCADSFRSCAADVLELVYQ
jgi:hypothetical protein